MNAPTESGVYWVRQDYNNRATGERMNGAVEVVRILPYQRGKKPPELYVFGNGWKEKLYTVQESMWQWEKINPPTFTP